MDRTASIFVLLACTYACSSPKDPTTSETSASAAGASCEAGGSCAPEGSTCSPAPIGTGWSHAFQCSNGKWAELEITPLPHQNTPPPSTAAPVASAVASAPSTAAPTPANGCPNNASFRCKNGDCVPDEGLCDAEACGSRADCAERAFCVTSSLGGPKGCTNEPCCDADECSNGCASAADCPSCRPRCNKPPGQKLGTCR